MKIKETIFEELSIIWAEKLHSQMIVWLIKLLISIKQDNAVNALINGLFWLNWNTKHTINIIWTEIKNVDVYLETNERILIVENKLKSSEHSEQTSKYIKRLKNDSVKNIYWCFLTLIWEEAESEHKIWNNFSYFEFYWTIKNFNIDNQYFDDYLLTLRNVTSVLDTFLNNHTKYLEIFENWWLTKLQKFDEDIYKNKDEVFKYITKNQLETIFQKAFLHKIFLGIKWLGKSKHLYNHNSVFITESHGTAIIQVYYDKKPFLENSSWTYYLWMQFQWKTLKYNLANSEYLKSSSKEITKDIQKSFTKSFEVDDFTVNSLRTKAYISVSKIIDFNLYGKSVSEIISFLDWEIKKFNTLCNNHFENEAKKIQNI